VREPHVDKRSGPGHASASRAGRGATKIDILPRVISATVPLSAIGTHPRLNTVSAARSHNNCGGVCVRGGQRHWRHLLDVFPDRYAHAEAEEQRLRAELGDVAILRERRGGVTRPLPLTELRRRHFTGS
jgi:hypothetical protein